MKQASIPFNSSKHLVDLLCQVLKLIWFIPALKGAKLIYSPFPLGIQGKKGDNVKVGLLTCFLLLCCYTGNGQALRGNAKSMVVTPPLDMKYTLGGYGARMNKPAEGIHDDIRAKALVISDGQQKFVIVTMDIVGFPPNVRPMVAEKLKGSGWSLENILLLPSHSHTSLEMLAINDKNAFNIPAVGIYQPELLDYVVAQLVQLIQMADKDLIPIKVGTAQIVLDNLNRNRRGDTITDKELTVTRIDATDGKPLAVLVNWTAHPTIMDEHDMWVSGGWPGYLQRELEEWIGNGVVAMYYNGAEGDQSVIAQQGTSHYERAEYYGRLMATKAIEVYRDIEPSKQITFVSKSRKVALPAKKPHPSFMQTGGAEYQLTEENVQGLLNQLFPSETYITALKLGELVIVGAPGEMIAELGIGIKQELKKSGVKYPVIGGLANEWISYILTESEYGQGGYETSVSFYGPGLGKLIQTEMIQTAKAINK
ncbi:MAG: neutral/alkaline non-lysosomal ceramidase N-terminal domain-containing protein [Bacteroidota bacterium]